MKSRMIRKDVFWMGAVDWDRRLFDSLIPLPDGTSYNAYLVRGSQKTALLDTADPSKVHFLMKQLQSIEKIDYVVAHHAEQDHSGSIPMVLEKYKNARVIATPKGKGMLVDHLMIPEERITAVEDGETLSLGDRTLEFIHTPWVHWPETMVTHLREEKILFSCDFFGSHLATSDLFVTAQGRVYESAKRYYAEIMMPFRAVIRKNIEKVEKKPIEIIAPSHGPMYNNPKWIIDAYRDWTSDEPKNEAVVAYVSMHDSTRRMVEHLVAELAAKGVTVSQFDLSCTDIGKLAMALVDAATLIVGTPTVHVGPHPMAAYAAFLANALRPKLRYASIIGSYGWSTKVVEYIAGMIPNLKVDVLPPVLCKGFPQEADFQALTRLAETVAEKHRGLKQSV